LLLFPCTAFAKSYSSFGPLTVRDQNPVYLQSINLQPRRARMMPPQSFEVRLDSAYSNVFEFGNSSPLSMMQDMELWRIGINARYALNDKLEVGMEMPFIHTWTGFLDPFIQGFHNLFGLPNRGRDLVPDNQYTYHFNRNGERIYNVGRRKMGLGDITFSFKHHLLDEGRGHPELAWFFDLKLPTGIRSDGLGNGNIDYGFGLALEKHYKIVHGYLNTAYYVSSRDDILAPYTYDNFFAYMAAVEVTLLPTWSILAQINGQTSLLKGTGMNEWDGVPLALTIGFKGEEEGAVAGNDLIWQFGFMEDVTAQGPTVDFTVFLSIGMRFDVHRGRAYKSYTVGKR
jgi:hypothetical protein